MADNFTSALPGGERESLKALGRAAINSFPDVTRSLNNIIADGDVNPALIERVSLTYR